MSSPNLRTRPDQIAELTRGIDIPLAALDSDHLEILAEGLGAVFRDLQRSTPDTMTSGSEAEVNALMEARLNAYITEDPLWESLVSCVVRGKESLSYNGCSLEKRPDLSIYLTGRARNFPLIAECKLIDSVLGKDEKLYCTLGLARFLRGDYAWASQEAFMIAYVRDGSSICTVLTPYLLAEQARLPGSYAIEMLPSKCGSSSLDLARSRHGRFFKYVDWEPSKPRPISIWHLWLT